MSQGFKTPMDFKTLAQYKLRKLKPALFALYKFERVILSIF